MNRSKWDVSTVLQIVAYCLVSCLNLASVRAETLPEMMPEMTGSAAYVEYVKSEGGLVPLGQVLRICGEERATVNLRPVRSLSLFDPNNDPVRHPEPGTIDVMTAVPKPNHSSFVGTVALNGRLVGGCSFEVRHATYVAFQTPPFPA